MDQTHCQQILLVVGQSLGQSVGQRTRNETFDNKVIPKPKTSSGKDEAWPQWCMNIEALLGLILPAEEVEQAARSDQPELLTFATMADPTIVNAR